MICKLCPRRVGYKGSRSKQLCWTHYFKSKPGWKKKALANKKKRTNKQVISDFKQTNVYQFSKTKEENRTRLREQLIIDGYL